MLRDASNGSAITLNPAFSAGHLDYSASVGSPVSQVTVRPTKNDAEASIRYLDELNGPLGDADTSRSGFQVGLAEGAPKVVKVEVTAEDGTPQTYTLTVTRTARLGEVLLSEKVLSVTEGSTGYYSVVLSRRPAANVRVTVTRACGRAYASESGQPGPSPRRTGTGSSGWACRRSRMRTGRTNRSG